MADPKISSTTPGLPGETVTGRLPGDTVESTDPIAFALDFVLQMRKRKDLSHTPSVRTSLAIPRFLTARLFRVGTLSPRDYLDAAVLNTPYEDQKIAWEVGREILFPTQEKGPKPATPMQAEGPQKTGTGPNTAKDAARSILEDLAAMDVDLDALDDLSALDNALETAEDQELFGAFDLLERLGQSQDPVESATSRLVQRYGGASELEVQGIRTKEGAMELVRDMIRSRVGSLDGDEIADGCAAGFSPMLLKEIKNPWELAGALAGSRDFTGLQQHVQEILKGGTAVDIGRTLRFLEPHAGVLTATELEAFRAVGRARVRDLSEHAELLDGLKKWMAPDDHIIKKSALDNPQRALAAARWLDGNFHENLQARVFDHWADARWLPPNLDELLDLAVNSPRWEQMAQDAFRVWAKDLDEPQVIQGNALRTAQRLRALGTKLGETLSTEAMTVALESLVSRELFFPILDTFLESGFFPTEPKRIVDAGVRLGLMEEDILERLGRPLDQLQAMIMGDMRDADRYNRLVPKIDSIPSSMLHKLVDRCVGDNNLSGMAACLAVDMAGAAGFAPADFTSLAVGYKGIGGGTNLLKQWFDSRGRLDSSLREKIKKVAKEALINLSIHMAAKGSGTTEQGMVPQTRSRPFRGGDDLDQLDIESTLDAIISAGKPLDQVTEEDLYVPMTSKGKAAFAVLIDISGSMGGRELANCAISVVMLLGKLAPEEVAIALFESDTHVIKPFDDGTDLDHVADRLLDLAATGGTRVDRAMEWVADQFRTVPESEFRLFFLLSDYCFFESPAELEKRMDALVAQDIRFMGAAHGSVDQRTAKLFQDRMPGEWIALRDLDKVPSLLQDAITRIGNGW